MAGCQCLRSHLCRYQDFRWVSPAYVLDIRYKKSAPTQASGVYELKFESQKMGTRENAAVCFVTIQFTFS